MSFFGKLFSTAHPPASEIAEAKMELDRLAEAQPGLAVHAHTSAALLPILLEPTTAVPPGIDRDRMASKLAAGVPVLRGERLDLEPDTFCFRWGNICATLVHHVKRDALRSLEKALADGAWTPEELVAWTLSGSAEQVQERAEALGLDSSLAATVLRFTLFPSLTQTQQALTATVPDLRWDQGFCWVCGAWPLLGEFRGLEQFRFLRCGWCAASWSFPRLRCPFCGNDDHRQLGYFHREGEEGKERIATCDSCRGYVKMISSLTPLTPPRLLVQEVATLPLDLIAADRGYHV